MKAKTKRRSLPKIVRIEVRSGVANLISKPSGVHVLIVDQDCQNNPADESCYYSESMVIRNGERVSW